MTKPSIQIEVVSDVVCPWCFIGKRRLERAISAVLDDFSFRVWYSPFELNPDLPEAGVEHREYLVKKFGSADRFDEINRYVTGMARTEGMFYAMDKIKKSPNTRFCHRILWEARATSLQAVVKERLMEAFFMNGVDLTDRNTVMDIAVTAGMDRQRLEDINRSNLYEEEVKAEEAKHRARNINGVPYFIINEKYGLSGAQPVDNFIKMFERAIGRTQTAYPDPPFN